MNNTNAPVTVTWAADNSIDVIDANSYTTFEIPMRSTINDPRGISVTYTCEGLFLQLATYTDYVSKNETTIRTLESNIYSENGDLKIINNTNSPVTVTWIAENNQSTIDANSFMVFHFSMKKTDSKSITASYTCSGDYLSSQTYQDIIYNEQTTTRSLEPDLGCLKITNDTDGVINVTWSDNSTSVIRSYTSMIFHFNIEKKVNQKSRTTVHYTCAGWYLSSTQYSDEIFLNETTSRTLEADLGYIDFTNQTAGNVYLDITGLDNPITISAYDTYSQAWHCVSSSSSVSFSIFGDYVFYYSHTMPVVLHSTGVYTIQATAACVKIKNNSSNSITEVYLSPHSDTAWGSNDMSGTISSGNSVIFTVVPNNWDVMVVDDQGSFATWTNNSSIDVNEMLLISYDTSKQHIDNSTKSNGVGSTHQGNFRIQQVQPPVRKK